MCQQTMAMRDYGELVKSLRICADSADPISECCFSDCCKHDEPIDPLCMCQLIHMAADAIEELSIMVGQYQQIEKHNIDAIEKLTTECRRLREAVPHWISVEEPPNNDRNVFICHGSTDFKAPCIGHYDPGMKMFYEDKNWFASPIYDAMFWCEMPKLPLPEPPKED